MSERKRSKRQPQRRTPDHDVAMLVRRGWERRDAQSVTAVADALSRAGEESPETRRLLSRRVLEAVKREPVAHGAPSYLTDPEWELGWRALAQWLDGDERTRLLTFAAACTDAEHVTVDTQEAATFLDEQDLDVLTAARAAEARGEFARALELLRAVPRPLDDAWRSGLLTVIEQAEELSPALWGRWICGAALRYSLDQPAGLQTAMHYAAVVLEACGATPSQIRDLTLARAMQDQVVHDVLLFDCGGLAGYLEGPLAPDVAARVPGIDRWSDAPFTVFRLVGGTTDGGSTVRCLSTGSELHVGDAQLADENPTGTCFVGRPVQVAGDDRWWFATRPTMVDELTAGRLGSLVQGGSVDRRLVTLFAGVKRPS